MNPADQRDRHTAVTTIARRQDDLETVLQALAAELVTVRAGVEAEQTGRIALAQRILAAIEELHTARLEDLATIHQAIDAAAATAASTRAALEAYQARPLGARLASLIGGA
jgi:hypothetical protein